MENGGVGGGVSYRVLCVLHRTPFTFVTEDSHSSVKVSTRSHWNDFATCFTFLTGGTARLPRSGTEDGEVCRIVFLLARHVILPHA